MLLPLLVLGLILQGGRPLAPPPRVEQVAWLQGCWAMAAGPRTVEEQWLAPRASSMLGVGRTTRGTTLIEYEMILIRERGDRLSYEPHPSEQEPSLFMSTAITDRSVEFENLKHDFPQRVGYQRPTRDRLLAWIEGPQDGRTRRIDYIYDRVPCPGD